MKLNQFKLIKIFFITILTIIFLNAPDIFSQSYNPNRIGFFIGPALSNLTIDFDINTTEDEAENKKKIGFIAGASIDLLTSERFTLYSELYFNRKVGEGSRTGPTVGFTKVETTIDYISYDISGRFDLAGKSVIPFIFAGPRIDFYLSDKIKTQVFPVSKISEKITRVGMGITGGIGLEFYTGEKFSFQTSLQFSPSFYDIYEDDYTNVKSNSFELKVGTKF